MAKALTLEQIDQASQNLPFQDKLRHFENFKIHIEDLEKELAQEKSEKEDKLLAIKNLGK